MRSRAALLLALVLSIPAPSALGVNSPSYEPPSRCAQALIRLGFGRFFFSEDFLKQLRRTRDLYSFDARGSAELLDYGKKNAASLSSADIYYLRVLAHKLGPAATEGFAAVFGNETAAKPANPDQEANDVDEESQNQNENEDESEEETSDDPSSDMVARLLTSLEQRLDAISVDEFIASLQVICAGESSETQKQKRDELIAKFWELWRARKPTIRGVGTVLALAAATLSYDLHNRILLEFFRLHRSVLSPQEVARIADAWHVPDGGSDAWAQRLYFEYVKKEAARLSATDALELASRATWDGATDRILKTYYYARHADITLNEVLSLVDNDSQGPGDLRYDVLQNEAVIDEIFTHFARAHWLVLSPLEFDRICHSMHSEEQATALAHEFLKTQKSRLSRDSLELARDHGISAEFPDIVRAFLEDPDSVN